MSGDLTFGQVWPWLVAAAGLFVSIAAAAHVILHKRDVRAAIGWTGLVLFSPFLGAAAYYFLGINRIRRRAARIGTGKPDRKADALPTCSADEVAERYGPQLGLLSSMVGQDIGAPLLAGNAVSPLVGGDEAYPAMTGAIRGAERSVVLSSYIFDHDRAGLLFADALQEAASRGVEVRVLIDAVGARYSRPPMPDTLRARGITVAEFLRTRMPIRHPYMNLRNHRKILVVDGRVGFVGGMNIRGCCLADGAEGHVTRDLHFRVEGPVVASMFAAVAQDWEFTTGERLDAPAWACVTDPAGPVAARGIPDGPDEDFETIRWALLSALDVARERVRVATPYFLPDVTLVAALNLAAMRGVTVDLLLPENNNLRFVKWASTAQLWQVLRPGCRVWLTRGPFDHSKMMTVDGAWSLIGSANWDPRSLRLNFEYDVECYDRDLAGSLDRLLDSRMEDAHRLTLEEVDGRSLPVRLRDGVTRLFSPYL